MKIDDDAKPGRFGSKFAYHDSAEMIEQLEEAAKRAGVSAGTVVRSAVRAFLRDLEAAHRG